MQSLGRLFGTCVNIVQSLAGPGPGMGCAWATPVASARRGRSSAPRGEPTLDGSSAPRGEPTLDGLGLPQPATRWSKNARPGGLDPKSTR